MVARFTAAGFTDLRVVFAAVALVAFAFVFVAFALAAFFTVVFEDFAVVALVAVVRFVAAGVLVADFVAAVFFAVVFFAVVFFAGDFVVRAVAFAAVFFGLVLLAALVVLVRGVVRAVEAFACVEREGMALDGRTHRFAMHSADRSLATIMNGDRRTGAMIAVMALEGCDRGPARADEADVPAVIALVWASASDEGETFQTQAWSLDLGRLERSGEECDQAARGPPRPPASGGWSWD